VLGGDADASLASRGRASNEEAAGLEAAPGPFGKPTVPAAQETAAEKKISQEINAKRLVEI
jgi:hypothetical protein